MEFNLSVVAQMKLWSDDVGLEIMRTALEKLHMETFAVNLIILAKNNFYMHYRHVKKENKVN